MHCGNSRYSLSRSSVCARLQVVCVALHNSSAVLAHVIQSSERTLFLCNWEQPVEGERERSLTFLEAVLQARPAHPVPLKTAPSPCVSQTHTQVALQHNVCIVRLPSALHVVDLHTLRILQVHIRRALKYEGLLVALICSHCQLRKWMAGVAVPPYALFHRSPSGWALYLPIATRMFSFLMSTSSWCVQRFQ
jgi:hypothetical protein